MEQRIAGARNHATYLLADVDIVAEYRLYNLSGSRLEALFHKLFGAAQLDITLHDRFGRPAKPHEWLVVPLTVIDEAVRPIVDGSITSCVFERATASLVINS